MVWGCGLEEGVKEGDDKYRRIRLNSKGQIEKTTKSTFDGPKFHAELTSAEEYIFNRWLLFLLLLLWTKW